MRGAAIPCAHSGGLFRLQHELFSDAHDGLFLPGHRRRSNVERTLENRHLSPGTEVSPMSWHCTQREEAEKGKRRKGSGEREAEKGIDALRARRVRVLLVTIQSGGGDVVPRPGQSPDPDALPLAGAVASVEKPLHAVERCGSSTRVKGGS